MLRKIVTIDDLKDELCRYFETMRALPEPKRPGYAKNHLWEMLKPEEIDEDAISRFSPTQVDIADCWYVDANWLPVLSRFEYGLIYARCKEKPLPWKVLEKKHRLSRQMLDIYMNRALDKIMNVAKY